MRNSAVSFQPQQTIKLAINCATGELVPAESLLKLEEAEFSALRRSSLAARNERRRGGSTMPFQCAICKQPVFLSRYKKEESTNRWFVHDGKSEHCPWHEGNRLTPDQTKALIYRGQQEGALHQEMKKFLAHWLEADPKVSGVNQEQTTFGAVVKGEWRRPDVKCQYQGKPLVFEIQLSYTFLSDVIARDEFYRREGIFIIWVFAGFNLNRAVVIDEAFFNRRNLFVLDTEAMNQTIERGYLTFNGYRQIPKMANNEILDVWTSEFVELKDVTFPSDNFRPYFFDYDTERKKLEELREKMRVKVFQDREREIYSNDVDDYIDTALRYYERDYSNEIKRELLEKVDELSKSGLWRMDYDPLRDEKFVYAVLPVLLTIKLNKPIGYNQKMTVFRVIEAGLRSSKNAFAILYLWAYKEYLPTVTEKNRSWLRNYAKKVKQSIDAGEETYRRFEGYDKAIALLFPPLEKHLRSDFGTMRHENVTKLPSIGG